MCGNVEVFSHVEACFPHEGVFSHVQGEVFFCRPGHMLAPSKNFCGDLYPRILFPRAFSHLLPLSSPGDPGSSDVFTYSDPWPPDDPGWCLGNSKEITGPPTPAPPPPQQSMFLPHGTSQMKHVLPGRLSPSTDDRHRFPARGMGGDPCIPVLPGNLFSHGPGHISLSGNMFLHVDVCFPRQRVPLSPALPCIPLPQAQHSVPPHTVDGSRFQVGRS